MVTVTRVVVAAPAFRWVFDLPVSLQGSFPVVPVWSVPCPEDSTPHLSPVRYCGSWMSSYGGWALFLFLCSCWSSGRLVLLQLYFQRVSYLSVRYLYMGFRFNWCKLSRRVGMEAAVSVMTRRTTASSLGGSLSCRRRFSCRVL
ncbi:hypothetical protein Bca101_017704 [Brassica carinata]